MYVLISIILTMYSLLAAFMEISKEVMRLARKVQMMVPTNREMVVIQASLAVTGACCPYPADDVKTKNLCVRVRQVSLCKRE